MRWWYTIKKFYEFKLKLKAYLEKDCKFRLANILYLTQHKLNDLGISHLILDFDGVLAPHGEITPDVDVCTWLEENRQIPMYILTNKPMEERIEFFKERFPNIEFLPVTKKKPYPDGINYVCDKYTLNKDAVAIIDDRLATGVLAAAISGIKAFYIYPARANFKRRFVTEALFAALRKIERIILKII